MSVPDVPATPGNAKSKEEEVEENIRQALNFAKDLFVAATDKKWVESTTAETRYEELCKRAPQFSKAYPVCVNKMAEGRYNERAFRRFLDRQRINPGKGMEGFIERQADYSKFLYEEECKARGQHLNRKQANLHWENEYRSLKKWMKKIQKEEEELKNQFEEEQKTHLDQRRKEFLDFINAEAPPNPEPVIPSLENYEEPENTEGLAKVSEVAPTAIEVDVSTMSLDELRDFYRDMDKYYAELIDGIAQMNERIHSLEQLQEIQLLEFQQLEESDATPKSAPVSESTATKKAKPVLDRAAKAEARRKADAEIEALIQQYGLADPVNGLHRDQKKVPRRVQRV